MAPPWCSFMNFIFSFLFSLLFYLSITKVYSLSVFCLHFAHYLVNVVCLIITALPVLVLVWCCNCVSINTFLYRSRSRRLIENISSEFKIKVMVSTCSRQQCLHGYVVECMLRMTVVDDLFLFWLPHILLTWIFPQYSLNRLGAYPLVMESG